MENNTSPKVQYLSDEQIYLKHKKEYWLKFTIGFTVALLFIICFVLLVVTNTSIIEGIKNIGIYKCIRRLLVFIFAIFWSIKYGRILYEYNTNLTLAIIKAKKSIIKATSIVILAISILIFVYFLFLIFKEVPNIKDFSTSNDYQLNEKQTQYLEDVRNDIEVEDIRNDTEVEDIRRDIKVENISVIASHSLENQKDNSYQAANLLDNDETTVWATRFTGEAETLTFSMKADRLYKLSLINGYNKNEYSFINNSRVKDITVYINGILDGKYELLGTKKSSPEYITLSTEYKDVREVKLVISSVYEGDKWNDLCISDIYFFTKE